MGSEKKSSSEKSSSVHIEQTDKGLALVGGEMEVRGDFSRMLPRCQRNHLQQELLIKAVKPSMFFDTAGNSASDRNRTAVPLAIDATAGLGDDAFLLAACGFDVVMFERDEVIASLLEDALARAMNDERTAGIAAHMKLSQTDSIAAMNAFAQGSGIDSSAPYARASIKRTPAVILLDPMFPARTKNAAVKKKFQLIHHFEKPCDDEEQLLQAALRVKPRKVIVKRPARGPHLAAVKPSYSIEGKAVRYDVLVPAQMKPL